MPGRWARQAADDDGGRAPTGRSLWRASCVTRHVRLSRSPARRLSMTHTHAPHTHICAFLGGGEDVSFWQAALYIQQYQRNEKFKRLVKWPDTQANKKERPPGPTGVATPHRKMMQETTCRSLHVTCARACVLRAPPGPIFNESATGPGRRRSCPHCHTRLPTANACARSPPMPLLSATYPSAVAKTGHLSGVRAARIELFFFIREHRRTPRPCGGAPFIRWSRS
jgi:hypothetical protein